MDVYTYIYMYIYPYIYIYIYAYIYMYIYPVYIHVYIRLFTFIYLAFATTRTAEPEDDSPRAKMASVLLPIVRPDMMTSFLSEWEYWFVLTNSTTDKRFPGKLKCKYISNRIYTYIYPYIYVYIHIHNIYF